MLPIMFNVLKGVVLGLSVIYNNSNPFIIALMTFIQAVVPKKLNMSDEALTIFYICTFVGSVINNRGYIEPTYVEPKTIQLKKILRNPYLLDVANEIYSNIGLLIVDIACLHDEQYNSILSSLIKLLKKALEKMNDPTLYGTTGDYSDAGVKQRLLLTWASVAADWADIVTKHKETSLYIKVFGRLGQIVTPNVEEMIEVLFTQTAWPYTKRFFMFSNLKSVINSLDRIEKSIISDTSVRIDRLQPFLRKIMKSGFIRLPELGPATDLSFILWLFLQNVLSTPTRVGEYMGLLSEFAIDKDEFNDLLKHIQNVHKKLYFTRISYINIFVRQPITDLQSYVTRLIGLRNMLQGYHFLRGSGMKGGNPTEQELLKLDQKQLADYCDEYTETVTESLLSEIDTHFTLNVEALKLALNNIEEVENQEDTTKIKEDAEKKMQEASKIIETFHGKVVNTIDNVDNDQEEFHDAEEDIFFDAVDAAENDAIEKLEETFEPVKGGKRKRKQSKRKQIKQIKQTGGEFVIASITATVISMYGLAGGPYPAFYSILSLFATAESNRDVMKKSSNILSFFVRKVYDIYNEGKISILFRSNQITDGLLLLQHAQIKEDFTSLYRNFFLSIITCLFMYDDTNVPTVETTTVSNGVVEVQGARHFDTKNNIICPLLDIWIFLLEHVADTTRVGVIVPGHTEHSVESRAQTTWLMARGKYATYLAEMKRQHIDKEFVMLFDAMNIFFGIEDKDTTIPTIINKMLLNSMFYFKTAHLNMHWVDKETQKTVYNFNVAVYDENIKCLKNIRTLLSSNTTVRLDRLGKMLRRLLREDTSIDLPDIQNSNVVDFNFIGWVFLQNILEKPQKLLKLLRREPVNAIELEILIKNVSTLYSGLYITSWQDYYMKSTWQEVSKKVNFGATATYNTGKSAMGAATNAASSALSTVRSSLRFGGTPEEPDTLESITKICFQRILFRIELMNVMNIVEIEGITISKTSVLKDEISALLLQFTERIQTEEVTSVTDDIIGQLEEINEKIKVFTPEHILASIRTVTVTSPAELNTAPAAGGKRTRKKYRR